jgi:hypothetical protein
MERTENGVKVYTTFWKYHKGEGRFLMYDNSRKGKCVIEESWREKNDEFGVRHHALWLGKDGQKIGPSYKFTTSCGYDRGPELKERLMKLWED